MKQIIFLELNEVPDKIFKRSFKSKKYKTDLSEFEYTRTISNDIGELSPWITWPTVHRGITNKQHLIKDINQDVTELDKKFPTIMSDLASNGYKVGVFGSMHSGSVREMNLENMFFLFRGFRE